MYEEAYDLGFIHGKRGTYLASRNNPWSDDVEEHDEWETAYSDGFNDGEYEGSIEEE